MSSEDLTQALNRAYFFLKFRPRSEKEILVYLTKKSKKHRWDPTVVSQAIDNLKDQKLINDKDFINWFVQQRSAHKQKSEHIMTMELLRYGISKELIDDYFLTHALNEEQLAYEALNRKWKRFELLLPKDQFTKASSFLARRGFSFDIIKKTIAKIRGRE